MGRFLGDPQRASRAQEGMTLQWSPESIHDLIALRAHIADHDPAAAKRVALHILYCVEYLLSKNPKLGAPGRVPGTRELSKSRACTTPPAAGPTASSSGCDAQMQHFRISSGDGRREYWVNPLNA